MSEYQYYEFRAIDRTLSEKEKEVLRTYSSRANITSRSFVNTYNWGDFKGDTRKWMQNYFDFFIYSANWGTHELMFRFPKTWLNPREIKPFLKGESHSVWCTRHFVIIAISSQQEDDDNYYEDGSEWRLTLQPLRESIIKGDYRFFYLAWLASLQNDELTDETLEPMVPAGLNELSSSLKSLAAFLRLDEKLISVAATQSPLLKKSDDNKDYLRWLKRLSETEKTKWLLKFSTSTNSNPLRTVLWKLYQKNLPPSKGKVLKRRTVKELKELWLN